MFINTKFFTCSIFLLMFLLNGCTTVVSNRMASNLPKLEKHLGFKKSKPLAREIRYTYYFAKVTRGATDIVTVASNETKKDQWAKMADVKPWGTVVSP